MRLIDADKLRHELIMAHDLVGAKYVDMTDTVKAIPMGWIRAYTRSTISNADYWAIIRMVTKWEKENETAGEN